MESSTNADLVREDASRPEGRVEVSQCVETRNAAFCIARRQRPPADDHDLTVRLDRDSLRVLYGLLEGVSTIAEQLPSAVAECRVQGPVGQPTGHNGHEVRHPRLNFPIRRTCNDDLDVGLDRKISHLVEPVVEIHGSHTVGAKRRVDAPVSVEADKRKTIVLHTTVVGIGRRGCDKDLPVWEDLDRLYLKGEIVVRSRGLPVNAEAGIEAAVGLIPEQSDFIGEEARNNDLSVRLNRHAPEACTFDCPVAVKQRVELPSVQRAGGRIGSVLVGQRGGDGVGFGAVRVIMVDRRRSAAECFHGAVAPVDLPTRDRVVARVGCREVEPVGRPFIDRWIAAEVKGWIDIQHVDQERVGMVGVGAVGGPGVNLVGVGTVGVDVPDPRRVAADHLDRRAVAPIDCPFGGGQRARVQVQRVGQALVNRRLGRRNNLNFEGLHVRAAVVVGDRHDHRVNAVVRIRMTPIERSRGGHARPAGRVDSRGAAVGRGPVAPVNRVAERLLRGRIARRIVITRIGECADVRQTERGPFVDRLVGSHDQRGRHVRHVDRSRVRIGLCRVVGHAKRDTV